MTSLDPFSIRRRAEALASADTRTLKHALYGQTQTARAREIATRQLLNYS
jgi:hypothetical protein